MLALDNPLMGQEPAKQREVLYAISDVDQRRV